MNSPSDGLPQGQALAEEDVLAWLTVDQGQSLPFPANWEPPKIFGTHVEHVFSIGTQIFRTILSKFSTEHPVLDKSQDYACEYSLIWAFPLWGATCTKLSWHVITLRACSGASWMTCLAALRVQISGPFFQVGLQGKTDGHPSLHFLRWESGILRIWGEDDDLLCIIYIKYIIDIIYYIIYYIIYIIYILYIIYYILHIIYCIYTIYIIYYIFIIYHILYIIYYKFYIILYI